jgi:hypothetical protein
MYSKIATELTESMEFSKLFSESPLALPATTLALTGGN